MHTHRAPHPWHQALGLQAPIVQAPMAGAQDERLALAVLQAGGLGSLPAATLTAPQLQSQMQTLRSVWAGPVNVNFFCHTPPEPDPQALARWHAALAPYYRELGLEPADMPQGAGRQPFTHEMADVLAPFAPAVVSFHFGLPSAHLQARVRQWGAQIWCSATTVDEGLWLQAQGVDAVIAQGLQAGGHRGHFLSPDLSLQPDTATLVQALCRTLTVPVIAAGGIGDAADVRRMRALGASGVQLGTAYLCSAQAGTSALHRAALQSAKAPDTALTRLLTGRPARGIVTRLMRELGEHPDLAPAFPLATAALGPLRAAAEAQGRSDFSPLWSGQHRQPPQALDAAEITRQFIAAWTADD